MQKKKMQGIKRNESELFIIVHVVCSLKGKLKGPSFSINQISKKSQINGYFMFRK